ncbi:MULTISPECIES: FAD-binding oxidoreductase [Streptomyces]|uniref:FAD-binding oxidoreductase n=1 Tax=Streptomyces doudnae TaxID=3075536 RepID=A0ABD5EHP3_9ACTN|nr:MULTISPECIES: FAD-binding oxidoreductase [unclassified Streptomyces]MDT0433909.1 FAD-binding oxidoreductase [Streptomyces sp. DSM 41981]MYQ64662.1 FAD-binding protein [Streptomyces sp. SID4950]SCD83656.1 alkyldihydroxyacetonephosphate synthase [Streptomyces sp. SolWspMP-5a-2]
MDMLWSGWGDPAEAAPLPETVTGLLRDLLGVRPRAAGPRALASLDVPAPDLPDAVLDDLTTAVGGADRVRTDAETRVRHTRGKSTPDLLRIRDGDLSDVPAAVLLPEDHDDVLAVLRTCARHGLPLVPFGGGTSVVGGLAPARRGPFAALDLRRMDRLLAVDPVSRTATLQPGLRGPRAEELLAAHGFTLGHFPQSWEWATIGGFAATRSSGQASAGYGRFDEMVLGLTLATPEGTLDTGRAPRSAAGPDLRQLLLGSEGAFGVLTSVTVRVRPVPEVRRYEGWHFASFEEGAAALRRLAQDGPRPTVLRLSDETESLVGLAQPEGIGAAEPPAAGCTAVAGYEGTAEDTDHRQRHAAAVLRACGGTPLGGEPGERWAHGRYTAPYLRDALLDAGAFAETLETAAFWSRVPELYAAVRAALTGTLTEAGTPPLVMCHISHVYENGASLYFTVVSAQGDEPLAHWARAKRAANDAILAAGGTISHHHGVGTDHRDAYLDEAGPLGIGALRAVKRRLDPAGVLNPGVLLPLD